MSAPRRPAVSLHIERLVLHGLPLTAGQGARMQASLERELARLVAARGDGGAWGGGASRGAADVSPCAAPPQRSPSVVWQPTRPHQLGRALARSLFASIDPRGRP
jgi:hypothetical protein